MGITAAKIALPKYLLGFSFVATLLGAAILIIPFLNDPLDIITRTVFVILSIIFINIGTVGYLNASITKWKRVLCVIAGGLTILPFLILNLIGIVIGFIFLLPEILLKLKNRIKGLSS